METTRFDGLTRMLARAGSRRAALRLVAGGLTAGLLAPRAATPVNAKGFDPCAAPGELGIALCDGQCVILAIDRFHCGACGVVCEVEFRCQDGTCVPIPDLVPVGPPPAFLDEEPAGSG
jgi:hypothetical protein